MEDARLSLITKESSVQILSTLSLLSCSIVLSTLIVGAMAEWFVGPIMDTLINTFSEYLQDQFGSQTRMKKELERLRENHPKIQAVVYAASQAQIGDRNPALNKWVWQLRDAIDEADDLLDEFEYMKHKEHLSKNMEETKVRSATTSFLFESARKLLKVGERALKIDPNLKRLEEVVQKLDKVSAEVGTFLHLFESTKQEQQEQQLEFYKIRETGSLPKNDLIGRSEDKEFVMQWLRKPSNVITNCGILQSTTLYTNVSLLSIVGHGGMGKTTLLQHVYEDEMMKEFDLKMWVCVSNNFDVKKVITDMLESIKKKKPDLESLDALQGSLRSEVMSKKFLLVLDDIWDEEEDRDKSKWENVLAPLAYGSLGSKILVTTRMDSIASTIAKVLKKKKEILRLKDLKEDVCLQLLNTHAFADVENPDDHTKLRSIAREIVKKLYGSPLAAKVIGGVMNSSLEERHWIKVLNGDFSSAKMGQNDIFSILRLSYIFLPKPLQKCFEFCCLFPQDHIFHKDDLVRMWIAVGFIQLPSNPEVMIEDIGRRYLDVLVKKSFFDKFEIKDHIYYKMHDLMHDLAQSVSAQECFRVVVDKKLFLRIPETIRHLSVTTSNLEVLKGITKLTNLRSLYLIFKKDDQDFTDVLTKIFKESRSIRLLYIDAPNLKVIPDAIGYLIHLRYLYIISDITLLPSSINNLHHLQFITCVSSIKSFCDNILQRGMNNLFNLRHLQLVGYKFPSMHSIGKLTLVQELDWYYVSNENGYKIGELEHMNALHLLRIRLLENVEDDAEACNAKLCDKRNLTYLFLDWGCSDVFMYDDIYMHNCETGGTRKNIADPNLDERVLDNLQPHNNLKRLKIVEYMGVRSAIWMNSGDVIYNLEYVELHGCLKWQTLPPFGQLPLLKSLCLSSMPNVQRVDNKFHGNDKCCVFPSLEVLRIMRLETLENWFDAGVEAKDDCLFPRLTELYLEDCPNLQELPYLPPKLEKLTINKIGWKNLNCCSISKSVPLETLEILHCPNMTNIHLADEITRLAALRNLTIRDCPNLISLGVHQEVEAIEKCQLILSDLCLNDPSVLIMEPLKSFTSIHNLTIMHNDELVSFSTKAEQWFLQGNSSLLGLIIFGLQSMQYLPFSLESFSSLKALRMWDVFQVQQLPNIPASLEYLDLRKMKSLRCLPSLSTISSLKYLFLGCITPLKSLPDLPPSLCELILVNLDNLNCLPSCLPNLTSLKKISIDDVPQLRDLPDLPPSLKNLSIELCHSELMERCKKFTGSYWHKIAHIPEVYIGRATSKKF